MGAARKTELFLEAGHLRPVEVYLPVADVPRQPDSLGLRARTGNRGGLIALEVLLPDHADAVEPIRPARDAMPVAVVPVGLKQGEAAHDDQENDQGSHEQRRHSL